MCLYLDAWLKKPSGNLFFFGKPSYAAEVIFFKADYRYTGFAFDGSWLRVESAVQAFWKLRLIMKAWWIDRCRYWIEVRLVCPEFQKKMIN